MNTTTEVNAYEIEVREILSKLQQSERDVIADWLAKQHRLETEGPKAFSNVSVIVAWLLNRRYAISEASLTTALGNCQTNGHRRIYWKEIPKQDRAYVGGKPNHAHSSHREAPTSSSGEFYPDGRRNHNYTPPETVQRPAELPDAWQQIVNRHMTQWTTHSQKAILQAEYDRGIATGKSWREIGASLGQIVKGWERGR
jgi:hypothetical protein